MHNTGGRPRAGKDKIIVQRVGLVQDDWDWLALWQPGATVSEQARECVSEMRKFRPAGPNAFGHKSTKVPKKRLPGALLAAYAAEHGIRVEDAPAMALREFFEMRRTE